MEFIFQPYKAQLGSLLIEDLKSKKYDTFMFTVAYAKISGVSRLYDAMTSFIADGGKVLATIGIDQNNTSYEALKAISEISNDLFVFHNRSLTSTFHPKMFMLKGKRFGKIYIGSNNLTNGGLFTNYEISSYQEFDLCDPYEAQTFAEAVSNFILFQTEGSCCKKLSYELLEKMYEQHLVCTESEIQSITKQTATPKTSSKEKLFGTESFSAKVQPSDLQHLTPNKQVRSVYSDLEKVTEEIIAEFAHNTDEKDQSFYKALSSNDVDKKSSPGQIIIPIRFKEFFEPLCEPQKTSVGALQSEKFFNILYENTNTLVKNARVIFYQPAPNHRRQNNELRFALRNREIFNTFSANDVLVFSKAPKGKQKEYDYSIKLVPHTSSEIASFDEKYDWIIE